MRRRRRSLGFLGCEELMSGFDYACGVDLMQGHGEGTRECTDVKVETSRSWKIRDQNTKYQRVIVSCYGG